MSFPKVTRLAESHTMTAGVPLVFAAPTRTGLDPGLYRVSHDTHPTKYLRIVEQQGEGLKIAVDPKKPEVVEVPQVPPAAAAARPQPGPSSGYTSAYAEKTSSADSDSVNRLMENIHQQIRQANPSFVPKVAPPPSASGEAAAAPPPTSQQQAAVRPLPIAVLMEDVNPIAVPEAEPEQLDGFDPLAATASDEEGGIVECPEGDGSDDDDDVEEVDYASMLSVGIEEETDGTRAGGGNSATDLPEEGDCSGDVNDEIVLET